MQKQVLIAGGGIGGLAAALGSARAGWEVRLFERASAFTEIGAGVQIGPNVVRRLQAWGLQGALQAVAAFPDRLRVRSALTGAELAALPLGARAIERYGAAYATIHRADLHGLLLAAVRGLPGVHLNLGLSVQEHAQEGGAVTVRLAHGDGRLVEVEGDALIGADGLRGGTRARLLGEAPTRVSGHLAYRAVVRQDQLPQALRSGDVTAWLGPRLHVVQYPLRRGELLNVVAIRHGRPPADLESWDHGANAADLEAALARTCAPLQDLIRAVPQAGGGWRLWPLLDRPPVAGPHEMARGLVALLGDAAHPMRPYLAQGAGMAIEDAAELQRALAMHDLEVPLRLTRYALNRWQRNARVQERSRRNGRIFHATGPVRWGRDLALRLLGERLLDVPWLYRGDGSSANLL
ncbi:FAD-dependent monooxygenase [Alicycliphilus denitrificans]|uniref:FAD-dependent monooxygenase n=1 Tax=Alicycliphilus denitrificans TaxID=179636 RepID=UPI000964CBFB|nr:FAD-dependent monooxygenase [Alicycliphilus denitrificans]MBN9573286.1 FAD-dependent monooxygenase [Alicycliphilus denitrificans]OJW84550.1 MAG: FAD-dependent oxidoreductase [Alicycliphilus sp. 69-12]